MLLPQQMLLPHSSNNNCQEKTLLARLQKVHTIMKWWNWKWKRQVNYANWSNLRGKILRLRENWNLQRPKKEKEENIRERRVHRQKLASLAWGHKPILTITNRVSGKKVQNVLFQTTICYKSQRRKRGSQGGEFQDWTKIWSLMAQIKPIRSIRRNL